MDNNQLFIANKIKIGFRNRSDTFTGKLGYVIGWDNKKWRKEISWDSWRDKTIDYQEFDNVPTQGFVLNKGVKRYQTNRAMCRVYDPRGFEFEITIPNLLFILTEVDCGKKGLEGEFVYSWDGKDLVLLPVGSEEYVKSNNYTQLQSEKVSTKDYVVGAAYLTNKEDILVYLGYLPYYEYGWKFTHQSDDRFFGFYGFEGRFSPKINKRHIFSDMQSKDGEKSQSMDIVTPSSNTIKKMISPTVADFAERMEVYSKGPFSSPIVSIDFIDHPLPQKEDTYYHNWSIGYSNKIEGWIQEKGMLCHIIGSYERNSNLLSLEEATNNIRWSITQEVQNMKIDKGEILASIKAYYANKQRSSSYKSSTLPKKMVAVYANGCKILIKSFPLWSINVYK